MTNTHYAIITGPTTPDIQMIAAGDAGFCTGALTGWIAKHPLQEGQQGEVVTRTPGLVVLPKGEVATVTRNNISGKTGRLERLPFEGEFYLRSSDGAKVRVTQVRIDDSNIGHADIQYTTHGGVRKQWLLFANFSRRYQYADNQNGWD